jgi:large subunit ribosomal protein L29
MKRDEIRKLRDKTIPELQKDLAEDREALRAMKFDLAAGKIKNEGKIKDTRKKIARIMTFIAEKSKEIKNNG